MLFYAALFLLLHGTTVWSEVREVKVYEQTSGPNWSQHDYREPELVLSDWERSQSSRFICLYLHLSWCCMVQAVPGPVGLQFVCHQSQSDSGSLPCHEHQRFITSALLHRCVFFLLTLFSDSSKGPPLLASPSHAQVHFSDFSTLLFG